MSAAGLPPPIVKTFLLCRDAGVDPKKGLVLVAPMTSVIVWSLPITIQMAVFARLTAVRADFRISLHFTNPDGSPGHKVQLPSQTGHRDPFSAPGYCWQGIQFYFPQPGLYEYSVLIDGQEVYSDSIVVTFQPSGPSQRPPQANP